MSLSAAPGSQKGAPSDSAGGHRRQCAGGTAGSEGLTARPPPSISQHLPNRRTDKAAVQTGLCTWPQQQRGQGSGCLLCSPPPQSHTHTPTSPGRAFPCNLALGMHPPLLSQKVPKSSSLRLGNVLAQGSAGGEGGLKWPVGPVSNASQSPLCEEQKLSALKLGNLVTLGRLEHHHLKSLPGNVCSGWTWLLVGTLGASRAPCQAPWTAPHRCTHTPASGEADLLDWPPDRCLLLCVYCLRPPTATLISA